MKVGKYMWKVEILIKAREGHWIYTVQPIQHFCSAPLAHRGFQSQSIKFVQYYDYVQKWVMQYGVYIVDFLSHLS